MELRSKTKKNYGLSLIELLVALAISSILGIGIAKMYSVSKDFYYVQEDTSNLQESGRFVFSMLISDLRRAGYFGHNHDINKINGTESKISNNNTCPKDATWARMLDRRIIGLNDPVTPYDCIAADYLKGDILTLRYVDGRNEAVFDNNRYYLRSSFNAGKVFIGSKANDPVNAINDITPKITGKLRAYAYYVGDSGKFCKFNDSNQIPISIPTLYRESLDEMGLPTRQEVASGIENIQFKYGVDTTGDKSVNQYLDSNLISNDVDNVTPNWNQVVSVRFWVLARANCPSTRFKNTQTYQMGDVTVTVDDGFKRKLFSSTVALRN